VDKMVIIGSRYHEAKSRLRKKIRDGSIDYKVISKENQEKEYACYFCLKRIDDGRVWELKEKGKIGRYESESKFYLDSGCHAMAKNFYYFYDNPLIFN